jgi:hypothetical protein
LSQSQRDNSNELEPITNKGEAKFVGSFKSETNSSAKGTIHYQDNCHPPGKDFPSAKETAKLHANSMQQIVFEKPLGAIRP